MEEKQQKKDCWRGDRSNHNSANVPHKRHFYPAEGIPWIIITYSGVYAYASYFEDVLLNI